MPFRIITFISFFCLSGALPFFVQKAHATEAEYLAQYHKDFAARLASQEKFPQALEEYWKSLILNSRDKDIFEKLKDLSEKSDANGFSEVQRIRLFNTVEYIQFLGDRLIKLKNQNRSLIDFLQLYGRNQESISLLVNTWKEQIFTPDFPEDEAPKEELDALLDFPQLNLYFDSIRSRLLNQLKTMQEAYEQLYSLKLNLTQKLRDEQQKKTVEEFNKRTEDLQTQVNHKNDVIKEQKISVVYLESEFSAQQQKLENLQQKVQQTNERLTGLTRDLAGMTLQIYEKDNQLAQKSEDATKLSSNLQEAEERLSLVQRIIQEKDDQITQLQKAVSDIQDHLGKTSPSSSPQMGVPEMGAVRSELDQLHHTVVNEIARNKDTIIAMQEQLDALTLKYQALETVLQRRDDQIVELKDHLIHKDLIISDIQSHIVSKEGELAVMSGVAEIYRDKLHKTLTELDKRNEEVQKLRQQLANKHISAFDQDPLADMPNWNFWSEKNVLESTKHNLGLWQNH